MLATYVEGLNIVSTQISKFGNQNFPVFFSMFRMSRNLNEQNITMSIG